MTAENLVSNLETFVINPVIWLLFSLALVLFLWGVTEFFINFGSDDGQKTGKEHMLWGILGMAIMLSALGIFNLVSNTICGGPCPKPSEQIRLR